MPNDIKPLSFFLNEQHELTRGERESGGGAPKLAPIDWAGKGKRLQSSLRNTVKRLVQLDDPIKDKHYFMLARPQRTVDKLSVDKKRAPDGKLSEPTSFAGKDSRVFSRLGMDFLRIAEDGSAMVHMTPDKAQQLETTTSKLSDFGIRDQARYVTLDSFDLIPIDFRVDDVWLQSIKSGGMADAVIELQPLLGRAEVDLVIRAIALAVQPDRRTGQIISGNGTDFSGRHWLRGRLSAHSIRHIAARYSLVQTLHSPLISTVSGNARPFPTGFRITQSPETVNQLPTVAIVDTGIPVEHAVLAPLRRSGGYTPPTSAGGTGDHGSFVASRVVFGDLSTAPAGSSPPPSLRFYDVNVALGPRQIDNKYLFPALDAVVGTAPDIRVFNFSFNNKQLGLLPSVERSETLIVAQDLDNFIFQNDILVVASAGNAREGISPATPYPNHKGDPNWGLDALASGFNAVTCGSYVNKLTASGIVKELGWPSPFCRIGPGLNSSPKPDFSAPGGNSNVAYSCEPGLGVLGTNRDGTWSDRCGTSYSAPIVAREAALAFRALEPVCVPGTRPYATTVKAFLALTTTRPILAPACAELIKNTLGYGTPSSENLAKPNPESAIFIWQGILEDKDDIARIEITIPKEWLMVAKKPSFRAICSADVPVNYAALNIWASRKINFALKAHPDARALRGRRRNPNEAYPLSCKDYNLNSQKANQSIGDTWLIELDYEQIADYLPSMAFSSQQRVSFACELWDAGKNAESPQSYIQALPVAATMTRLSAGIIATELPIALRVYE